MCLWVKPGSASLLLCKQLLHEQVVGVLQLLVHARHDADVVIVDQIHLFEVQYFRQLTCVVSKKEVPHSLRLERKLGTESNCSCHDL